MYANGIWWCFNAAFAVEHDLLFRFFRTREGMSLTLLLFDLFPMRGPTSLPPFAF